jgi:chaperonin GroEL (HSP60 family)
VSAEGAVTIEETKGTKRPCSKTHSSSCTRERSATSRISSRCFEFDASSGKYVDLTEASIIDPTKVVRLALENALTENAVSAAGVLLLTEATITEVPDTKPEREPIGAYAGL